MKGKKDMRWAYDRYIFSPLPGVTEYLLFRPVKMRDYLRRRADVKSSRITNLTNVGNRMCREGFISTITFYTEIV